MELEASESARQALASAVESRDTGAYMAALDDLRMQKLRRQLAYCFDNEFYKRRMRDAGVGDPRDISTIEEFRRLPPFLTKSIHRESQQQSLQEYGHPFGMHLCAPLDQVIHVAGTSGTTGLPTFYVFTRKDLDLTCLTMGRAFARAGIRPGDSVLQMFGLSIWVAGVTIVQALEAYGARPIPLGAEAGVSKALQYIEMCRPRVLFGTPSLVDRLVARAPEELGRELSTCGLEVVVCAGEPGMAIPSYRSRLVEGTGARFFDFTAGAWLNSAMDCGGPEHHGLHYLAEDYCFRYDLVDPETREPIALEDGAVGEAIHTTLDYEAAPALRYATGDILRLQVGECPQCGVFGSRFDFVGRADDLLNVAGVKVYPTAIKEVVEELAPHTSGQMQVVLNEPPPRVPPPVPLTVEAGPGVPEEEWPAVAEKVHERIHHALRIRTRVTVVGEGTLPRSDLKTKLVDVVDA